MAEIIPLPVGRRPVPIDTETVLEPERLVHSGWPETCPACFDAHKRAVFLVTGDKPEAFE